MCESAGPTAGPGLILLDLNMSAQEDGREALATSRPIPALRPPSPVVVLTDVRAEEDVYRTYDLGVNSFIADLCVSRPGRRHESVLALLA